MWYGPKAYMYIQRGHLQTIFPKITDICIGGRGAGHTMFCRPTLQWKCWFRWLCLVPYFKKSLWYSCVSLAQPEPTTANGREVYATGIKDLDQWKSSLMQNIATPPQYEIMAWSVDISHSEFDLTPWLAPKRMLIAWFHFDPSYKCFYRRHISERERMVWNNQNVHGYVCVQAVCVSTSKIQTTIPMQKKTLQETQPTTHQFKCSSMGHVVIQSTQR